MSALLESPSDVCTATSLELQRRLGLTHTVAAWLVRRGLTDPALAERFLSPRLAHLTPPDLMADRERVADRLARAVRAREPVVVFGDYDCDGITSAAILTELLRRVGGVVTPIVANRFEGGYGLSPPALEKIIAAQPTLVVTCDCGSSDHAAIESLGSRGVDVVVIDHHLVPEVPLPALAFLNPHRPQCEFPYKGLASCGLALSVAAAVRKRLDVELDVREFLDLVAIGTVADVAPLDGDNRALVRAGLRALRLARRPGIRALLEVAGSIGEAPLTARDVAFRIAPHINAAGRLGSPKLALDLLLATTLERARSLAAELSQVSERRRELSTQMESDALAEIEREGYADEAAIVVGRPGWNPGVVGIVAGRLASRFDRPVIVVGFEGDLGRGSVRGPAGVRLHDALRESAPTLEKFGGHQRAAGVEVRIERLPELRAGFVRAVRNAGPGPASDVGADLLPLDARDDPMGVLSDLDRLEPCGEGNPRPRLVVSGRVASVRAVKNGHLKLDIDLGRDRRLSCFSVGQGERASMRGDVKVVGDLRHNEYPGAAPVELFAEQLHSP